MHQITYKYFIEVSPEITIFKAKYLPISMTFPSKIVTWALICCLPVFKAKQQDRWGFRQDLEVQAAQQAPATVLLAVEQQAWKTTMAQVNQARRLAVPPQARLPPPQPAPLAPAHRA